MALCLLRFILQLLVNMISVTVSFKPVFARCDDRTAGLAVTMVVFVRMCIIKGFFCMLAEH
jgi:hypothetical protein